MKTPASPTPTRPELQVLKLLWREGHLSAREIHDRIGETFSWAYSTTRTTLDRMVKKDLLLKKDFHGLNIYGAGISRARGLATIVRDFAESVLDSDYAPVVSLFADAKTLDADELAELRALLDAEAGKEKDPVDRGGAP